MRSLFSVTLLLLLVLTFSAEANKRPKSHRGGKSRPTPDCSTAETQYGRCVPHRGDCGDGLRDATCKERTDRIPCKIPCNWKKDIGDCKYKFGPWGSCDSTTQSKARTGTLKRALFHAECNPTITLSKPCTVKGNGGVRKSN